MARGRPPPKHGPLQPHSRILARKGMPASMSSFFTEILQPQRLTEVVDIGANPIDGDPPYKPMLAAGLCKVTGSSHSKPR